MVKFIGDSKLVDVWATGGTVVQPNTDKIESGWLEGEKPPHEYMNWLQNTFGSKLNHILQHGIPRWDIFNTYGIGDVVTHNNDIWISTANANVLTPTTSSGTWIKFLLDKPNVIEETHLLDGAVTSNKMVSASYVEQGAIKLASLLDINEGVNDDKAVTPLGLKHAIDNLELGEGNNAIPLRGLTFIPFDQTPKIYDVSLTANTSPWDFITSVDLTNGGAIPIPAGATHVVLRSRFDTNAISDPGIRFWARKDSTKAFVVKQALDPSRAGTTSSYEDTDTTTFTIDFNTVTNTIDIRLETTEDAGHLVNLDLFIEGFYVQENALVNNANSGISTGYQLEYINTTSVKVKPGLTLSDDFTTSLALQSELTLSTATVGVNGLDASLVADRMYAVYVIYSESLDDYKLLASQDFTNPSLPVNYTKKKLVGVFHVDGSSNIRDFIQKGKGSVRRFFYNSTNIVYQDSSYSSDLIKTVDLTNKIPSIADTALINAYGHNVAPYESAYIAFLGFQGNNYRLAINNNYSNSQSDGSYDMFGEYPVEGSRIFQAEYTNPTGGTQDRLNVILAGFTYEI